MTIWRLIDDPDLEVRLAVTENAQMLVYDAVALLSYMSTDRAPRFVPSRSSASPTALAAQ